MDETAPKPKLTKKQKDLVSLAFEVGLILLLIGIGTVSYNKRHTTTRVEEKTVTVTASPQPQGLSATLPIGSTETVTVPVDAVAAGYKLTLTAPKAWRTVEVSNLVPGSNYPAYNADDLAALLRFVPDLPERGKLYGTAEPINLLDVLATTRWVTEEEGDPASAANKRAYLAYLGSLKSVDDITAKKCVSIGNGSVCTANKVKPQIIKSADGSLSGVAYLSLQMQSVSYDPVVVVDMVGTVGGKAVRASGKFAVYDKTYETLSGNGVKADTAAKDWTVKVDAARIAFLGGKPEADTVAAYDRIVAVVKSLKFAK
jgi:hypothetical protein